MTDRELLELAAKAAGMPASIWWWVDGVLCKAGDVHTPWNPLADDGDALRLAVKLKIPIQFPDWADLTRTWGNKGCLDTFEEPHDTDPLAATRRAITRAAAEIGRNMK